jgi:hypothetical protein
LEKQKPSVPWGCVNLVHWRGDRVEHLWRKTKQKLQLPFGQICPSFSNWNLCHLTMCIWKYKNGL